MTATSGSPCWKSVAITSSSIAWQCGRPNKDGAMAELGLAAIRLYTSMRTAKNIALYGRHGYAEIGTRPHATRVGELLVDMVRAVPSSAGSEAAFDARPGW